MLDRHPTEDAQRLIDRGHHRRQRLVQQRQHHPEPAPRQPRQNNCVPTPSTRGPSPKSYWNRIPAPGSTADAPAAGPTGTPTSPPRPPGGWCVPNPHTPARQLVVHHIRADPTTRVLDPLLQLRQERIDEHRPPLATSRCQPALLPRRNIIRDRVMRTPGQHRRVATRTGQIESFQNLHDLLSRLHSSLLGTALNNRGGAPPVSAWRGTVERLQLAIRSSNPAVLLASPPRSGGPAAPDIQSDVVQPTNRLRTRSISVVAPDGGHPPIDVQGWTVLSGGRRG